MTHRHQRYPVVYSGTLTIVFAVTRLTGAAALRDAKFDTIDEQRINVREADGTLRMLVSNKRRRSSSSMRTARCSSGCRRDRRKSSSSTGHA